jgi:hypothetical protein
MANFMGRISLITPAQLAFLKADGGHDIHRQLDLSGEPLVPPLRKTFQLKDPMSLITYQELTIEGRDYEGAYSDYWNSTADEDGKCQCPAPERTTNTPPGEVVDAVIMPVAPHAAVIPGKFYHTGTQTHCSATTTNSSLTPSSIHRGHQPDGLQRRGNPRHQSRQGD